MKMRWILTIALLSLFAMGCEKEIITPEAGAPEQMFTVGHSRPSLQCGLAAHANFTDNLGTIEILNDSAEVFILTDMAFGWQMQEIKVFAGETRDIPLRPNGELDVDNFPYYSENTSLTDLNTLHIPTNRVPATASFAIWGIAVRTNLFGVVLETREVWVDATPYQNGYFFDYALGSCGDSTI